MILRVPHAIFYLFLKVFFIKLSCQKKNLRLNDDAYNVEEIELQTDIISTAKANKSWAMGPCHLQRNQRIKK